MGPLILAQTALKLALALCLAHDGDMVGAAVVAGLAPVSAYLMSLLP